MRTMQETRLECLRLANMLATGKNIKSTEVIHQAQQYLDWIEERETQTNLEPLRQKFATR